LKINDVNPSVEEGAMLTATRVQDAIDTMLADGRSFAEIEDFIAEQPVPEDTKSALWLWAWAEQPRAFRRELIPIAGEN
jgi:hypothetical protein